MRSFRKQGLVIKPAGTRPWPHEERVASILALAGHRVEFIPEGRILRTADILLDNTEFEIKSPVSGKIEAVGRNLSRASGQSANIIFDGSRMKNLRDAQIIRVLKTYLQKRKRIKKIIFINRRGQIIDINSLV